MESKKTTLFWHRRDLRITDNAGLFKALKHGFPVQPVFIFDTTILEQLPRNDQRVLFIHREINALKKQYLELGSDLLVVMGNPIDQIPELVKELNAQAVFTNRDYEPYALQRDKQLAELLQQQSVEFVGAKDHVIFEKGEVVKADGKPYTVFTPYMRRWKENLSEFYIKSYPVEKYVDNLLQVSESFESISLEKLGFSDQQTVVFPGRIPAVEIIQNYHETRDIPSVNGTSRLSLHLRFGTISIRELVRLAQDTGEKFLNELIWRDFYQMIIFHFPQSVTKAFKPEYDRIKWEHHEEHFRLWCEGKTGYPLVDAGMRELNTTGHMHNRVRMVTASFLTKHLLLDWRWGERYFAEKLLDFELASNVGGWQWAASSGCDAAPYFRVFNPTLQQEKFDPKFEYIRKWIPEFGTETYPQPIVDHAFARERVLTRYKNGLS
ncbi:MAG: deoxyribodipyrimidine photolyase [Candidatus Fluviicola riflensis]|nr:MAG: deoxyribodipyrimidine photolyase [Candidatus Fluviicola riflensis]OGS78532.1 MAG: deoxyribodipyrimidine photolyase [Candidatus Fluviicola riflensis]OGS84398.1 MAG: deoxyribodipyrimidine photolyase [Fluviicola sp. RIFCSPHIGHO2_12_FULL_43_24]OGS85587.1 MAG: deoxyribodipyrimidine photolyase [Fluviicola sp. RIFCSPHIGHO2_01_FULL_43_53]